MPPAINRKGFYEREPAQSINTCVPWLHFARKIKQTVFV